MEHLNIERTKRFLKVYTDPGYFITKFKDGDNIKTYNSATLMYCPLNIDLSQYRVIDEEKHQKYQELWKKSFSHI